MLVSWPHTCLTLMIYDRSSLSHTDLNSPPFPQVSPTEQIQQLVLQHKMAERNKLLETLQQVCGMCCMVVIQRVFASCDYLWLWLLQSIIERG